MKTIFYIWLMLWTFAIYAGDGTTVIGNGGDACESRILEIRNDLKDWIKTGGYIYLELPSGISQQSYKDEMLKAMSHTVVSCTQDKIFYGSVEKTCKNLSFFESGKLERQEIVCNFDRFNKTDENNQYRLTHHEYAGLSGFEANDSDESNYFISNQISAFLEEEKSKRLVVKPIRGGRYQPISVVSVANASNFDLRDMSQPVIYGGLAGVCAPGSISKDSTCDSCVSGDLTACNNNRIHDALNLKITFIVTADIAGRVLITKKDGVTRIGSRASVPPGVYSKGDRVMVSLNWGALCASVDDMSGYSCDEPSRMNSLNNVIFVGVDKNNDGRLNDNEFISLNLRVSKPEFAGGQHDTIDCDSTYPNVGMCNFDVLPGKEKLFFTDFESINGVPYFGDSMVTFIRAYYSNKSFMDISNSSNYFALKVTEDGSDIENAIVAVPDSELMYYFRLAMQDNFNNVYSFTSDQAIMDSCGDHPKNLVETDDVNCPMMARPLSK